MRSKHGSRKGGRRAFSLLELVLSLGLLAAALVVLVTLFIQLFQAGNKAGHTASGVRVAETVLNQQLHAVFHDAHPLYTRAAFWSTDGTVDGGLQLAATDYSYQLDFTTVVSNTGGATLGASLAENRLKAVHVRVWWWGPGADSTRTGQGRLTVELCRLVNENDDY